MSHKVLCKSRYRSKATQYMIEDAIHNKRHNTQLNTIKHNLHYITYLVSVISLYVTISELIFLNMPMPKAAKFKSMPRS